VRYYGVPVSGSQAQCYGKDQQSGQFVDGMARRTEKQFSVQYCIYYARPKQLDLRKNSKINSSQALSDTFM